MTVTVTVTVTAVHRSRHGRWHSDCQGNTVTALVPVTSESSLTRMAVTMLPPLLRPRLVASARDRPQSPGRCGPTGPGPAGYGGPSSGWPAGIARTARQPSGTLVPYDINYIIHIYICDIIHTFHMKHNLKSYMISYSYDIHMISYVMS